MTICFDAVWCLYVPSFKHHLEAAGVMQYPNLVGLYNVIAKFVCQWHCTEVSTSLCFILMWCFPDDRGQNQLKVTGWVSLCPFLSAKDSVIGNIFRARNKLWSGVKVFEKSWRKKTVPLWRNVLQDHHEVFYMISRNSAWGTDFHQGNH